MATMDQGYIRRTLGMGGHLKDQPPSLRESVENLRVLARDLADVPEKIRTAPVRVAQRPEVVARPQRRVREARRSAAWLLATVAASSIAAALVILAVR